MSDTKHNDPAFQVGKVKLSHGPRTVKLLDFTDKSVVESLWADANKSRAREVRRRIKSGHKAAS